MISNAIGLERLSTIVGYKLTTGNFSNTTPNLPQSIAILAEANTANQTGLTDNPIEILSAQQAGKLFGYGSPIHNIMRILRPIHSDGVGGIPTIVYPQVEAGGATARTQTLTVTGTATKNGTHNVIVGGREGVDGSIYSVNIAVGDTPTVIATKIKDSINAVLGSPVTATSAVGVVTSVTKWKGLTAQGVELSINTGVDGLGITYAISQTVAGSGTPTIATALTKFGNVWHTIVINSYGAETTIMDALESFNGIPDTVTPTGRYQGAVMKPFIALTGSVLEDPSTITDTRKDNLTIAICPAPLSKGHPYEAAANMAVLFARITQDTPHLDVQNKSYQDMPTPSLIGYMDVYNNRDAAVKKGCSTVELLNGKYNVKDFVTTYHPVGETPAQFRYCRNLMLDFNVRFAYYILEQTNVLNHAIAGDFDTVSASNVIKPKQWKAILMSFATELGLRGLVADVAFMQANIVVDISATNPDRLETFFKYKRTGYLRIASTTAQAGFNFGSN